MIKLIFQADICVADSKAKTGYTPVSASKRQVQWDVSNDDLAALKLACYCVARSDLTGQSLESLL